MKLLTYPDLAKKGSKLWYICQDLGIEITRDLGDFDRAIYWNTKAVSVPDKKISSVPNVINIRCTNVLKDRVDKAWYDASGYTIQINPRNFKYAYIRKSKQQYRSHTGEKHDGRIFDYNQKPEKGYVYQRYVRTKPDDRYITIRVPVFKRHIPCLILKYSFHPFKEMRTRIEIIREPRIWKYIKSRETDWLFRFCDIMGLDFGEVDMIRDKYTMKIYAIDVNNIAGDGIYGKLSEDEVGMVRNLFAKSFKAML